MPCLHLYMCDSHFLHGFCAWLVAFGDRVLEPQCFLFVRTSQLFMSALLPFFLLSPERRLGPDWEDLQLTFSSQYGHFKVEQMVVKHLCEQYPCSSRNQDPAGCDLPMSTQPLGCRSAHRCFCSGAGIGFKSINAVFLSSFWLVIPTVKVTTFTEVSKCCWAVCFPRVDRL